MIPELCKKEKKGKQIKQYDSELMQKREERETKEQYNSRTHAKKRRTGNKVAV